MNYVFVDFENGQEIDLPPDRELPMALVLLVGEKQRNLKTDLVEQLLARSAHVQLVRMTVSGRNALDLTLACHLGRVMAVNPSGYFHIISKDKDFDALVSHLKGQGHRIARHDTFAQLPFLRSAMPVSKAPPEPSIAPMRNKIEEFVASLQRNSANRPKKSKTLHTHLKSHLGGILSDDEVAARLSAITRAHGIVIDGKGAVTYPSSWSERPTGSGS